MPKITRIVRAEAGTVGTQDGYVYRWTEDGQAIDVLERHQTILLSLPGYTALKVTVRAEDLELVLPAIFPFDPDVSTAVPPAVREEGPQDLSDAVIEDPVLPEPELAPQTAVQPAEAQAPPAPRPVVDDGWGERDIIEAAKDAGLLDLADLKARLAK